MWQVVDLTCADEAIIEVTHETVQLSILAPFSRALVIHTGSFFTLCKTFFSFSPHIIGFPHACQSRIGCVIKLPTI